MPDSSLRPRAFIGTRDLTRVDPQVVELFVRAARATAEQGITLHTGAAPGADQKAAEEALNHGGPVKLFLPWWNFEVKWVVAQRKKYQNRVQIEVYDADLHPQWRDSVELYHPTFFKLVPQWVSLHARNYGIVHQCGGVVALPRATGEGGTAQGVRVARALGIPVYDLSTEEGRESLTALLEEKR